MEATQVTTETSTAPVTELTPSRSIGDLSPAERLEWRKTGEIPAAQTESADSSSATAVQDPPASTDATPKLDSEPSEYKTKTAKRIEEVLEKARKAEERAERVERELAALRQPPPTRQAASSTATVDAKPDPAKYDDLTKYFDDLSDWKVRDAFRQRDTEVATRTQEQHINAEASRIRQGWQGKWAAAKAKHADFEQVAGAPIPIAHEPLLHGWIMESDEGAEVLYYLQKNPAEVTRIQSLSGLKQAAALVKLGEELTKPTPVKKITSAPDPAPTLGVRGSDAIDDVTRAAKTGNVRDYIRAANRADMAAKGH